MAVLPPEIIARVKDETDIVELVGRYVRLQPAGSSYKGLCPFHQEKTPSFHVNPLRQSYKCFGCGVCVSMCEFHAPGLTEGELGTPVAQINEAACKGCGTCAGWCPSGAIVAKHFTDDQVHAMIDAYFCQDAV